jgi:hypothetical protein
MSAATSVRRSDNGLGPIEAHVCYPWPVLIERMGWTRHSARAARRAGLLVRKVGKRQFVLGSDVLAFIEQAGKLV